MTLAGYITQSIDTSIDAELVQFKLWREMSSSQKLGLVRRVYRKGCGLILLGIRQEFSEVNSPQFKRLYWRKRWGYSIPYLLIY